MARIRMAQYGTKHGHAAGKLIAMLQNPNVEVVGVYEPDQERRAELEKGNNPFRGLRLFRDKGALLDDPSIVAVASEGQNDESLEHTEELVRAGKHVWYDKPAGDNWEQWRRLVALAETKGLLIQMGYMFRYHDGFRRIAEWAQSGLLGDIFGIRAHMSTNIPDWNKAIISRHAGGIFYDLAGHVLDQIVWILGRPQKVTAFLRSDERVVPGFKDNTLGVFGYERAMVFVDIAAMEPVPMARRFEVYGLKGSAIMEPFEPVRQIRLCMTKAKAGFKQGEQFMPIQTQTRQQLYNLELEAFIATITGQKQPDRTLKHELLVQETLLRATGGIPED